MSTSLSLSLSLEQPKFDIEQFRTELTQLRESFADNSYITFSHGTDPASVKLKEEKAEQDYEKILDLCVEALLQADDKDTVANLIRREFVEYYHQNGNALHSPIAKIQFWQDISLKLAKKTSAPAETAETTAETQEAAAQTTAITTEVGAAAQEASAETGRNLLEIFASLPENHYPIDRADAMQVGDYIEMTRAKAYAFGFKPEEGKDRSQLVKIRITKITRGHVTCNLEVELDGQTIRIDGSLFYNFGKSFVH